MRILQINSARSLGGGERHLADLANGLQAAGVDVFVALRPGSAIRSHLFELPQNRIREIGMRNAFGMLSAVRLARIIRENQIQIVHAHLARDYPIAAAAARFAGNCELVVTRHVMFPLSRLHRFTLARAARVIAVSRAAERALKDQSIFPHEKIRLVHNGVDFERLDSRAEGFDRTQLCGELGLDPEMRFVGTVGEITPLKGQAEFLRAAAIVAEQVSDAAFLVMGEDNSADKAHERALQNLIGELGLRNSVFRFGWLDNLPAVYRLMEVFVSASHTESFGLAIAEAMAMGTAVVATATDGAKELIQDGETGLLVKPGDSGAIASGIVRMMASESDRARIGTSARAASRSRFGTGRMVEETLAVYREILDQTGSSGG